MSLAVKVLHLFPVFVGFLAYPMGAEVCLQDFRSDTVMQCRNCTGALKVVVTSDQSVSYSNSDRIRNITCTVNKHANVSISFKHYLQPYYEKPLELTKDGKVKGITVTKLNGGCTYQIHFKEKSKSLCQYGHFTCKAVTDANETKSEVVEVYEIEELVKPLMTFTAEDAVLRKNKQLIIGTSTNLSCKYESREWNANSPLNPFIKFFRVNEDGIEIEVQDSDETPMKYELEGRFNLIPKQNGISTGTRRLFLRRIDEDAAATYLCRVKTLHGCHLETKLVLETRPCKAGHYCNQNSSKELQCREGTYSNITGSLSVSNCRVCPINSYCPSGSSSPKRCPNADFFPARKTTIKLYNGKGKIEECRICPVDPCDKEGSKCSFICSDVQHSGILGQPTSIRCSLSNRTLLRNLTWFRGEMKIVNGSSYAVCYEGKDFVLKIHKLSQEDFGNYNCSGFDVIMGNHFYNTINLVATEPGQETKKNSNMLLTFSLSLSLVMLFVVTKILLVRKYLRRSRYSHGTWRRGEDTTTKMLTPIVSETFSRDNRVLYTGNPSKYDVFICYSSKDKTWVRGTLLPKLKSFNLQVCIDFEDFSPGSYIIENVAEAIYSSRKTVAVLSPDFLNSDWCHKELMMALTRVSNEHKVIPVMYRECQVPVFLCEVTYLDWCNKDVRQTFWDQLLRTLKNGNYLEINDITDCLEEDGTGSTVDN